MIKVILGRLDKLGTQVSTERRVLVVPMESTVATEQTDRPVLLVILVLMVRVVCKDLLENRDPEERLEKVVSTRRGTRETEVIADSMDLRGKWGIVERRVPRAIKESMDSMYDEF